MKCIVSGGRGFIGSRLVDSLVKHGHEVAVWSRTPARETRIAVSSFYWDPLEREPSEESLNRFDAVVHLAGEPVAQRWTAEAKRKIRDSRVLGTQRLVAAIAQVKHRPAALISASAVGFYGSRGDEELTEASSSGSGFLPEICREWEHEADAAAAVGLRVAKIRIGVVLGREGGALPAMLPAFKLFAGGSFGSGKQWMPWIHVDDLVEMFRYAVENPFSGVLNGCSPNPVTNAQFTAALRKALRRPAFLKIPAFALKALLGEMSEVLLGGQRAYPKAAQTLGLDWRYTQLGEALRDLLNS
jgi:uncharacterized protein